MNTMPLHRTATRGLSLVEVMVAMAILVFVVAGVYSQFLDLGQRSRNRLEPIEARLLAHQELEHLRACRFESLKNWKPPFGLTVYPEHVKYSYLDQVKPGPQGLLELSVQVGWNVQLGKPLGPGNSITVKGYKAP